MNTQETIWAHLIKEKLINSLDQEYFDEVYSNLFEWEVFNEWIENFESKYDKISLHKAILAISGAINFYANLDTNKQKPFRRRNRPTGIIRKRANLKRRCSFVALVLDTENKCPLLTGKYLKADWSTVVKRWKEKYPIPSIKHETAARNYRKWFDECLPILCTFWLYEAPIQAVQITSQFFRSAGGIINKLNLDNREEKALYNRLADWSNEAISQANIIDNIIKARTSGSDFLDRDSNPESSEILSGI
jgi:hypothetical protein